MTGAHGTVSSVSVRVVHLKNSALSIAFLKLLSASDQQLGQPSLMSKVHGQTPIKALEKHVLPVDETEL